MIQIPITEIYLAFAVLTRVTAMFLVLPVFSSSMFPVQARLGLAGIIAIMLVPMLGVTAVVPSHLAGLVMTLIGEILIGLMLGFAGRLLFFAVEFAAELISREAALMRAQSFDPTTETQGSVLAPLYFFLTLMVFMVTGTHLEVLAALVRSYDLVPVGLGFFAIKDVEDIARQTGGIFALGLRMAAPVMAMAFVVNLIFAILGKVAAKVNVLVLSFGVRIVLSMLLLAMSVALMLRFILSGLDDTGMRMLEFISSG